MIGPKPYIMFPGTTRDALAFYAEVFGGTVQVHTLAEFGRTDGPPDAIAHGSLDGPVALYGADAVGQDESFSCQGLMLSLLGTSDPATLTAWFGRLAEDGRIVDDLQARGWGASDGQVVDRFGLHWLIGFQDSGI
jgi:PhnB protein